MTENSTRTIYSYDLFNQIIADLNQMLELLNSDQIDETQEVERTVGDSVKQVYMERHRFNRQELVDFCLEYQKLHEKIVSQIAAIKENIDESQKNKKIAANKIFTYTKMNNLKY
ncbi:MAG: hypothetical protein K5752_08045 [Succinivibrionaceae bacterium]|jgi:hypothetical protein|nr:hypothetical protein [Succinivibrionaceae bacterium]